MISKSLRKACALCVALVVSTSVVACQQLPAPDPAESPVAWATEAVVTLAPTITTELAMTGTVPAPNAGYSVVAGVVVRSRTVRRPRKLSCSLVNWSGWKIISRW